MDKWSACDPIFADPDVDDFAEITSYLACINIVLWCFALIDTALRSLGWCLPNPPQEEATHTRGRRHPDPNQEYTEVKDQSMMLLTHTMHVPCSGRLVLARHDSQSSLEECRACAWCRRTVVEARRRSMPLQYFLTAQQMH